MYKRFVFALSEKDVPRLGAVVATFLKQGGSMRCAPPLVCLCGLNAGILGELEFRRVIYGLTRFMTGKS